MIVCFLCLLSSPTGLFPLTSLNHLLVTLYLPPVLAPVPDLPLFMCIPLPFLVDANKLPPGLFEECPADFSFLRMQDTPPSGGDTLWVSGYELYERRNLYPSISGYIPV